MSSRVSVYFQNLRLDYIQCKALITCACFASNYIPPLADYIHARCVILCERIADMAKNLLLEYAERLASEMEVLCKSIKHNSNTIFQLRKSSSSVFANITEAQYPQSLADMLSKLKIARKECVETESWLKLLFNINEIDEPTFRTYRNLCGRIQRMLTSSCITIENRLNGTQKEI